MLLLRQQRCSSDAAAMQWHQPLLVAAAGSWQLASGQLQQYLNIRPYFPTIITMLWTISTAALLYVHLCPAMTAINKQGSHTLSANH
jgi:hypothetical protein